MLLNAPQRSSLAIATLQFRNLIVLLLVVANGIAFVVGDFTDGIAMVASSTQVVVRGTRRRFTADYKASIVQQAAQCRAPGEIGAMLRREGLSSLQLTMWRRQHQAGVRRALSQRRGPTAARTGETAAVARLERENAQ